MEISKDFREFIELLNEHNVKYLIVGGYAVNFHGYSRFTRDIDFWVWMDDGNINQLMEVINEFGFGSLGLTKEDFLVSDNIVQLGNEPHRIDILVDVDGVEFTECFEHRKEVEFEGLKFQFLSLDDLIKAKKAMHRLQDLADTEQLEKLRAEKNKPKR